MAAFSPQIKSLITCVAGFSLAIGGLIVGLYAVGVLPEANPGPLPGWVGSAVWTFLFISLAIAFWIIRRHPDLARSIVLFAGLCLAYPFYTFGFQSLALGLIGNLATFAAAAALILKLRSTSRVAAAFVAPVLPWLLFATWIILIEAAGVDGATSQP